MGCSDNADQHHVGGVWCQRACHSCWACYFPKPPLPPAHMHTTQHIKRPMTTHMYTAQTHTHTLSSPAGCEERYAEAKRKLAASGERQATEMLAAEGAKLRGIMEGPGASVEAVESELRRWGAVGVWVCVCWGGGRERGGNVFCKECAGVGGGAVTDPPGVGRNACLG